MSHFALFQRLPAGRGRVGGLLFLLGHVSAAKVRDDMF